MKVERLYEIALDLQADLKATKVVAATELLVNALQNQINSPNPEHQQHISNERDKLMKILASSRVNQYPPSWLRDIEAMDLARFLGLQLSEQIAAILSKNQITPNDAHKEIGELKNELESISNNINYLVSSLKYLEFTPETLFPGEYEIGVTIPRAAIHNEMGRLGKELQKLERIFGAFSEIVTGSRAPFTLRAISTTDPTIFIDSIPEVAAAIAFAIERCVALYNGVLDLIIKHKELKEKNVPENVLSGLKDHIGNEIKVGLKVIADEIKDEHFKKIEATRKPELEGELLHALNDIAARLDAGYGFDVRGEESEEAPTNTEATEGETREKKTDLNYKIVSETRNKIRYFKPQGEPILGLPAPIEEEASKNKASNEKKK